MPKSPSWENVRFERRPLKEAGFGTYLLAIIFVALICGGISAFFGLEAVRWVPFFSTGDPNADLPLETIIIFLSACFVVGAVLGALAVLALWPRPEEFKEDDSPE